MLDNVNPHLSAYLVKPESLDKLLIIRFGGLYEFDLKNFLFSNIDINKFQNSQNINRQFDFHWNRFLSENSFGGPTLLQKIL